MSPLRRAWAVQQACRGLEKALDRMRTAWDGLEFRVLDWKDTGTYMLGGIDDVQARAWPAPAHPGIRLCFKCSSVFQPMGRASSKGFSSHVAL